MAWYDDFLEKTATVTGDLVDGYKEAELEKLKEKPEPANTANAPTQDPTASAAKYSDVAAAAALDKQTAANAANADFLTKYGKWLAVGGGTVAVMGVLVIAMKGK